MDPHHLDLELLVGDRTSARAPVEVVLEGGGAIGRPGSDSAVQIGSTPQTTPAASWRPWSVGG